MTNPLDDAIDRAVREMMHVDAPSDMRGRVLTHLGPRRPQLSGFIRLGLAAAAAVVLVFALTRALHPRPKPEAPPTAARSAPVFSPAARDDAREPDPDVPSPRRLERKVTATVAAEAPETIRALPDIAPLVVPPPEHVEIEPDAVVIAPLGAIPDVRVDPLPFPPGLRD